MLVVEQNCLVLPPYAADAAKNTVTDAMEILPGRGKDNGVF